MALLHIYDSSDPQIVQTVNARSDAAVLRLPISNSNPLAAALDRLVSAGRRYDRVLFETHGAPGLIFFSGGAISASWWRGVTSRNYNSLTTPNARVYFNGCNVAEGAVGWAFLDAAAAVFLARGGGQVFGQTSVGFGNPFNGHVFHLWGSTRRLFVAPDGRVLERFEE